MLGDQARRHAVDAALADAAAKIPGSALFRELGLGGGRGQRLVDRRDGQAVALGQCRGERARPPRDRCRAFAFGNADDELRRSPVVDDAIDARAKAARDRTRSVVSGDAVPVCAVRGGDAYTTEPEIERDEEVARR